MEDRIARLLQRIQEIEQLLRGLTLELQGIQQELAAPASAEAVPVVAAVPASPASTPVTSDSPRVRDTPSDHLSDGSRPPKPIRTGDKVRFFRTTATCAGIGIIKGTNKGGWLIIKRISPKGPCLIDPVTRAPWKVLKLDK